MGHMSDYHTVVCVLFKFCDIHHYEYEVLVLVLLWSKQYTICSHAKKSDTNPAFYQAAHKEIVEHFPGYNLIYTDGSLGDSKAASAAVLYTKPFFRCQKHESSSIQLHFQQSYCTLKLLDVFSRCDLTSHLGLCTHLTIAFFSSGLWVVLHLFWHCMTLLVLMCR